MSLKRRDPPYLPFLKGPADFAPNLRVIDAGDWLPFDTEATAWLNDKRLLMKLMRDKVSAGDLDGEAAREVLALVLAAMGETPLQAMPTALEEAASLVSDDFCILEEERRGDWRLSAGVLCARPIGRCPNGLIWTLAVCMGLYRAAIQGCRGVLGGYFQGWSAAKS